MTGPGYTAMENGGGNQDIGLAAAVRLANALGLRIAELVSVPESESESVSMANDDAAALGALLRATGTLTPVGALADVLGWPIGRVHAAEAELAERLRTVGQSLRRSTGRLAVDCGASAVDQEVMKSALRRHLGRDHLSLTEARMLRHVEHGDTPTQPSNPEQVALGTLVRAELVTFGDVCTRTTEAPMCLSEDVRFSLMLDDVPDAGDHGRAPRRRRSPITAPGGAGRPRRGQPLVRPERSGHS